MTDGIGIYVYDEYLGFNTLGYYTTASILFQFHKLYYVQHFSFFFVTNIFVMQHYGTWKLTKKIVLANDIVDNVFFFLK